MISSCTGSCHIALLLQQPLLARCRFVRFYAYGMMYLTGSNMQLFISISGHPWSSGRRTAPIRESSMTVRGSCCGAMNYIILSYSRLTMVLSSHGSVDSLIQPRTSRRWNIMMKIGNDRICSWSCRSSLILSGLWRERTHNRACSDEDKPLRCLPRIDYNGSVCVCSLI